ncbi:MAG: hypothetical protein Q9162_005277 [Coniocarpon cinnabarinum]
MSRLLQASLCPPFPDDVPVADLYQFSLSKLVDGEEAESRALFEACTTTGFFLLDLQDHDIGKQLLASVPPVFDVAEELFSLDFDEKDKYSFKAGQPIFGYKGTGVGKIDKKGTPDRCEFWSVSKDDILSITDPRPNPAPISENRDAFQQFMTRSHALADIISGHLDAHLELPPGTLSARQRLSAPSGNQVRLVKIPPQAPADRRTSFVPHTDIGAITVLFNALGGLQILPPAADASNDSAWCYVKPVPGSAIINIGDAMVQWTSGALRSNMHRVTFPPGEQGSFTRYSAAYFARPVSDALMIPMTESALVKRLVEDDAQYQRDQETFTAEEWEMQKGISLRLGTNEPQSSGGRATLTKVM